MGSSERRPAATAHTIAVVLASAAAREDLRWLQRRAERRFEFRLLAAAGQEHPQPPAQGWHDLQRLLKVQVTPAGNELRLSLQAEGYAVLQRVAGRAARLLSADGALDMRVRFDAAGHAFAALAGTPAVLRALEHFSVLVDEPQGAP